MPASAAPSVITARNPLLFFRMPKTGIEICWIGSEPVCRTTMLSEP